MQELHQKMSSDTTILSQIENKKGQEDEVDTLLYTLLYAPEDEAYLSKQAQCYHHMSIAERIQFTASLRKLVSLGSLIQATGGLGFRVFESILF